MLEPKHCPGCGSKAVTRAMNPISEGQWLATDKDTFAEAHLQAWICTECAAMFWIEEE